MQQPDPRLAALAQRGQRLRDEQLAQLTRERPDVQLEPRRALGRPVVDGEVAPVAD